MIYLRHIVGRSMQPTLQPDQLCLFVAAKNILPDQIVMARVGGREVVKRVVQRGENFYLIGDNMAESAQYKVETGVDVVARLWWPKIGAKIEI